ncbi:hypothetical protein BDW62DRAFT_105268 [Aspergillus aurantiobrunneus]
MCHKLQIADDEICVVELLPFPTTSIVSSGRAEERKIERNVSHHHAPFSILAQQLTECQEGRPEVTSQHNGSKSTVSHLCWLMVSVRHLSNLINPEKDDRGVFVSNPRSRFEYKYLCCKDRSWTSTAGWYINQYLWRAGRGAESITLQRQLEVKGKPGCCVARAAATFITDLWWPRVGWPAEPTGLTVTLNPEDTAPIGWTEIVILPTARLCFVHTDGVSEVSRRG